MNKLKWDGVRGYIPKIIAITCRQPKTIKVPYENINGQICAGCSEIEVIPAFTTDNENAKTKETALDWAKNHTAWQNGKNVYTNPNPKVIIKGNKPFSGLRICDLEIRNEGGRAYKVTTPDNHLFDFREDVLLDTIYDVGIDKGGVLLGEYLWAMVGSQMKLIRYKSGLYDCLVKNTEIRGITKKITKSNWEIGGIYCGKNNEPKLFLGFVDTETFSHEYVRPVASWNNPNFEFKYKKERNIGLWYEIRYDDIEKDIEIKHSFNIKIGNPTNLIIKMRQIDINTNIAIQSVRDIGLKEFEESHEKDKKYGGICYWYLDYCLLRKPGGQLPELPEYINKILKNDFQYEV